MMRSLFSGVSGLRNHQTKMDVIGDNISNVNTIGFKKSTVNFQDLLVQTMRGASAPQGNLGGINAMQVGLGMGLGSISVVNTQGNLQNTGKTTDLAIDGDGFFVVSNGTNRFYSRTGTLDVDKNGDLIMVSNGLKVMGWQADSKGIINNSNNSGISSIKIQIGQSISAQTTSVIDYTKNLDCNTAKAVNTSIDIYDSQGNVHPINITFKKPMSSISLQGFEFDTDPAGSTHTQDLAIYDKNGTLHNCKLTITSQDGSKFSLSLTDGATNILSITDVAPAALANLTSSDPLFPSPFSLVIPAAATATTAINVTNAVNAKAANDAKTAIDAAKTAVAAAESAVNAYKVAADAAKTAAASAAADETNASLAADAKVATAAALSLANAALLAANNAKTATATAKAAATAATLIVATDADAAAAQLVISATTMANDTIDLDNAAASHVTTLNPASAGALNTAANDAVSSANTAVADAGTANTATTTSATTAATDATTKNALVVKGGALATPVYSAAQNSWEWIADTTDPSIIKANPNLPLKTGTITFKDDGSYNGATNNILDLTFNNGAAAITNLAIKLEGLTQYAGDTTVTGVTDGYASGSLQSMELDSNGVITGSFSNGLTQALGQVALATFNNPGGLIRQGGSLYKESNNSGTAQIGTSGNGGRGKISPGALEMANVDLAQEFTDMIITQRGFQANSKIITTTDEMLELLANLKR